MPVVTAGPGMVQKVAWWPLERRSAMFEHDISLTCSVHWGSLQKSTKLPEDGGKMKQGLFSHAAIAKRRCDRSMCSKKKHVEDDDVWLALYY